MPRLKIPESSPSGRTLPKEKSAPPTPDDDWSKLSQRERFIRTARDLECDESGEAYRRALGVILPPRKPGEPAPKLAEQSAPKGSRRKPREP